MREENLKPDTEQRIPPAPVPDVGPEDRHQGDELHSSALELSRETTESLVNAFKHDELSPALLVKIEAEI